APDPPTAGKRGTLRPGAPARMHWPREAAGRPGERPLGSRACLSLVPVQAVAAGADLADIERARNVAVGTRRYDGSRGCTRSRFRLRNCLPGECRVLGYFPPADRLRS